MPPPRGKNLGAPLSGVAIGADFRENPRMTKIKRISAACALCVAGAVLCSGKSSPEEAMWNSAWTRFFSPKTEIFYDLITSYDPQKSLEFVPSPEDIKRLSKINPNGYSTGMEDGMILGGIMMCAVLDKYEVTKDPSLKGRADAIARGMARCALSPEARGFVARAVSASDGRSFFPSTSRDQYTHCVHGLYRYCKSPLATGADRRLAAGICAAVADRMIRNVTPETGYDALNADGAPSTRGLSKMWNVAPHEAARLPMIYAIAGFMTGEEKYWKEYQKYAAEAVAQSRNFSRKMAPWAQLQMQASLEVLRDFAETDAMKNEIDGIMREVSKLAAERLRGAASGVLDPKLGLYRLPPNPLKMPLSPEGKPEIGEFFEGPHRKARYFGEMALTMLARGAADFDENSAKLLAGPFEKIDYDRMTSCAVIFHLAAYWSAKKAGVLEQPR